jgi:hypothetical protein
MTSAFPRKVILHLTARCVKRGGRGAIELVLELEGATEEAFATRRGEQDVASIT